MEAGIENIDRLVGPRGTTDQVMGRIRDAIISGRISPGTWLREAQLATRLGVSRIPVREALARLEAEGLVERVPYRGPGDRVIHAAVTPRGLRHEAGHPAPYA
jgi:DNA-binding GntR family transcriptional regulator